MALTPSTMAPLSTPAPDFRLPDTDGKVVSLADLAGAKPLLVAFICNHCPYIKHVREAFARLARDYQARGVAVVAINSKAAAYPDDSPEKMKQEKVAAGYTFPYLYDRTQEVAKAYRRLHTGLLRLRPGPPPGRPRADGRQPAG
jgi:peroxiredoxin